MPDKDLDGYPAGVGFPFLLDGLKEALHRFQSGADAGREGAIHALETVVKFLGLYDQVNSQGLHAPLARLLDALISLDDGMASPLLKPKKNEAEPARAALTIALRGWLFTPYGG